MHILSLLLLLASSGWTIMPLGDSITAGGEGFSSYRPIVAQKLRAAGLNVKFVGSQGAELKHEGYPGAAPVSAGPDRAFTFGYSVRLSEPGKRLAASSS